MRYAGVKRRPGLPLLSFLILFSILYGSSVLASTCVDCHTNDATLRSLFQPPKMEGGEGEG